jgi:transcriptional regulator with XRE-family HTH domain
MLNQMQVTTPVHTLSASLPTRAKSKKSRTPATPNILLRYQRKMRNWTQAQLADELYKLCIPDKECKRGVISADTISRWEQGKRTPRPFWQKKLCVLFETTPDKLGLLEDPKPSSSPTHPKPQTLPQSVSFLPLDASLFEQHDFQKGVAFGRGVYHEEYEGRLSEEEMITLVEEELSRRARQREARQMRLINDEPSPFLVHLGVVIGVIDEAMIVSVQ